MTYITEDKYLKASEKVRTTIAKDWSPTLGNYVLDVESKNMGIISKGNSHLLGCRVKSQTAIPMLNLVELSLLIQYHTAGFLQINQSNLNQQLQVIISNKRDEMIYKRYFKLADTLNAFWKVLQEVIEQPKNTWIHNQK